MIGKFKDELGGKIMTEFCALRAKAYAFLLDGYNDGDYEKAKIINKKVKGTKKSVIKRELMFKNYVDALFNDEVIIKSQQQFRSDYHKVYTEEVSKIALSSNDDKRIQTCDRVTTFPYEMNVLKICENEMRYKLQRKKMLNNESQILRNKSQILRDESKELRSESQIIRNELKTLRKEYSQIIARSQKLREESKSLREKKSKNETDQIIARSQKLREESEKSRKESSKVMSNSQKLREELKSLRNESSQIIARSQKLREESKSLTEKKSKNKTDQIIAKSKKQPNDFTMLSGLQRLRNEAQQ